VRRVRLDGSLITSGEQFLDAVAAALDFPGYFGRNWNALDDCLFDINEPTIVEWTHADRLADADPESYELAISCFADATTPVELIVTGG
jgi:RNAse (barnase) inhibitor barstar